MKILYFDTETTGFSAKEQDIIQIAGIIEIDGSVKEEFNFKCQPFSYENISEDALKINGMTIEKLKTFKTPQEMYKKLIGIFMKYVNNLTFSSKFVPSGQNIPFDLRFLDQFFIKNNDVNFHSWIEPGIIDLLQLTTKLKRSGKYNFENQKLGTIAQFFNVPLIAHDALEDIKATRTLIKIAQKRLFEMR